METLQLLSNYFSIIQSPDRATAWIKLTETLPLSICNQLTGEVLLAYIKQQGITPTVLPVQLDFWIISKFPHHQMLINDPNPQLFNHYEIRLPFDQNRKLAGDERLKIIVQSGQTIAVITHSVESVNPEITPDQLLPDSESTLKELIGEGIQLIHQSDQIILKAEHDGYLRFDGHRLFILPYHVHRINSADPTVQLNFAGDVLIQGDVPTFVTIRAAGDVHINGVVEGATIISDCDIIVEQQVVGLSKAYLQAGGSITVGGAMDTQITAAGSITFHYQLVRCTIMTFDRVIGIHPNCRITGGRIMAYHGLETSFLGSADIVKSEVIVGLHPLLVHEFEDLKTHLQEIMLRIKSTDKSLQFLEDHIDWTYPDRVIQPIERCCYLHYLVDSGTDYPPDPLLKMAQLQFTRLQLDKQKELYIGKLNHIRHFGLYSGSIGIIIRKTAHPGIVIKMKNYYLSLNEEVSTGQFQIIDNQIAFQPNQGE